MGLTAAEGVTDGFGLVHGAGNLWVADASVFPTSMGVNPSLTIAALALRTADRIEREMR
jgi:choline dehydrogenase-like flavoprotein